MPDAEALLDHLDPEQREVALALSGPVLVLAGAGTGKTRALTARVAYGVRTGTYDPHSVLAVTFTTKAADQMRERLNALDVEGTSVRTFHAAALRQVRYFWPRLVGSEVPEIVADPVGLVREAAQRQGVAAAAHDLASEITWAKVSNTAPAEYVEHSALASRRVPRADPESVAAVYADYERLKDSSRLWDMEDVLLADVGLLVEYPDVAEQVRRRYRRFVVDEFQDVSPIQLRLLELWLGGRQELCVVGDPHQRIYSFAGASTEYLLTMSTRYPACREVRLWRNYRSTPEIVTAANRVLDEDAAESQPLVAQRPSGSGVALRSFPDPASETAGVADLVVGWIRDGHPLSQAAVLVRSNAEVEPIAKALQARGLGVVVSRGKGGEQAGPRRDGVVVSTLHAAKGKEWPFVVVAGLNEGSLPSRSAVRYGTAEAVAEERRLCYVGVTRAQDHLTLTYVATGGGGDGRRGPSRFLDPLLRQAVRSAPAADG